MTLRQNAGLWLPCAILVLPVGVFAGTETPTSDPARLPTDRQNELYRETLAFKTRDIDPSRFGFVEMVPIVGNIKAAPPYDQCFASILVNTYQKNTNAVATSWWRDLVELRRANAQKYVGLTQELIEDKLREIEGKAKPKHRSDATSDSSKASLDDDVWRAIVSIVPDIELLGSDAGYVDVRQQATIGLAVSLYSADMRRTRSSADVAAEILGRRKLKYTLHDGVECDWEHVVSRLGLNIPLVAQTASGHAYVVVGYYVLSLKERILFGYAPEETERSVYYGGQTMMESRLASFKRNHPVPAPFDRVRYSDIRSTHKQHQYPGFCALRFDESMRFTYIDEVTIDMRRIRQLNLQALDAALSDLTQQK